MQIAYLTNSYPSVSHTFIRRELLELERQVGEIARFSIRRSPFKIIDADDKLEDLRTYQVLSQPASRWVSALVRRGLVRPLSSLRGLRKATKLGFRSQRGIVRHLIYWIEALLLLQEMKSLAISHVHVHFGTNPTAVAQIMRAMGGPSYSFTVHGPDEFDAPIGLSLGSKIADAAFVVAITDFCAGQLRRWADHLHWDKIRVVHCTVGEEFFSMARPIDPESKTLVCVGRLSAQKAQLLLVEGFAMAIARGVDANLVLAGDGEMRAEIEDMIESHGLEDRVRITGWITGEQVRQEILASRLMALPSFAEGLPMVIMEAFALGRPVLATHIAGIPELVVDGESGWLIPSGAVGPIADGIEKVMSTNVEILEKMAATGRKAVYERHYTATETAKLAEHIRETVASNAKSI